MKWYYVLFVIFVVVISALSIYKAVTPQNYNSNGVSFDYPGTWTKLTPNQSDNANKSTKSNVVAVGDPNSAQTGNIIVLVQKTNKSGTLEEIVEASKADLKKDWGATMQSDNLITVDGIQAHDVIYTTNSSTNKKERMVIFDKNDIVYCIILGGSASAFDSQKNNFDMIVNSFKVTN
jgi:hypothetical protein